MLAMRGIVKSYGAVRANRGIDLDVPAGAIVGLLGENGSGKTTLMNVLYGLVRPDAGSATFRGRPLPLGSPRAALAAGIGMIHQHFMLVPAMSVTENVMLGWRAAGSWLRPRARSRRRGRHAAAGTAAARGDPQGGAARRRPPHPRRAHVQPEPARGHGPARRAAPAARRGALGDLNLPQARRGARGVRRGRGAARR